MTVLTWHRFKGQDLAKVNGHLYATVSKLGKERYMVAVYHQTPVTLNADIEAVKAWVQANL
jgi:hypothetical protein